MPYDKPNMPESGASFDAGWADDLALPHIVGLSDDSTDAGRRENGAAVGRDQLSVFLTH